MKIKKWLALLLAIIMLLSLAACSGSEEDKSDKNESDEEESGSEGDKVTVYLVEKTVEDEDNYTEYEYDKNGNLAKETTYQDGVDYAGCAYEYDENNNVTKRVHYSGSLHSEREYEYEYDSNGRITCKKEYDEDGYSYKTTYEYDEKGNVTKELEYYASGEERYRTDYTYDENGNLVFSFCHDEDGYDGKTTYTYDEKGNLIEEISYDDDDRIYRHDEYEYDSDGNLIVFYDRNSRSAYEYDSKGRVTKSSYVSGSNVREETYEYKKVTMTKENAERLQAEYGKQMVVIVD